MSSTRTSRDRADYTRFIDPAVLARIGNLDLVARTVVDGFISGLHRSALPGLSIDFAEHRAYMPGDDVRRIDWRVYARTDRLYVKEYEADTNANVIVILDLSKSMDFGEHISKQDYARYAAASLAYLSSRQRDRVGLVTFDKDVIDVIPPSAKHLKPILHTLDRAMPGGASDYSRPLGKVAESLKRRSVLVLISDLYAPPDDLISAVNELRYRNNDVIVLHVLDPAELQFPYEDATNVVDLETGAQVSTVPAQIQTRYRELVRQHIRTLETRFNANRIDYAFFDTSMPLDHILFRYLSQRTRLRRVR